jgi:2-C-methyl-D-erythritol 4-phosphate cytidylyltransferase
MGGAAPKQYRLLGGVSMLQITLNRMSAVPSIDACVVALRADDPYFSALDVSKVTNLVVVQGGAERSDSVLNALMKIREVGGDDTDWVLVHDAARPLIAPDEVERLINEVRDTEDGGLLVGASVDTLKMSDDNGRVAQTLERQKIFRALTPQMFRLGALYQALVAARDQDLIVTDDTQAMELAGFHPQLVVSDAVNIKVTTEADLAYAEYVLSQEI